VFIIELKEVILFLLGTHNKHLINNEAILQT